MRLSQNTIDIITSNFYEIFGEGKIFLFGSRVDAKSKGGDIDLYLAPQNRSNLFEKKIRFRAKLYRYLGEQKIDIVFQKDGNSLIEQEAIKNGVELRHSQSI
ncbi:MAG TPA: nucleotidyltransferase domain-containing protein [Campylobacterales bacterium]|nr:nucleotidyltransferase domain-containing protein [Campylobacterales bacterium]HIO71332.1 nucleotidyltransferase domain-containing protein [Campylobacterales bacterium]